MINNTPQGHPDDCLVLFFCIFHLKKIMIIIIRKNSDCMLVHTDITSNSARCVYSRLITTPGKRKTPSWLAGKHPNWQDCSSAEAKQKKWKSCASVPTWWCAGKKRKSKKFNLFAFGNEHNRKHLFGYFTASLSGWPVAGIFSTCYDQYICIFF